MCKPVTERTGDTSRPCLFLVWKHWPILLKGSVTVFFTPTKRNEAPSFCALFAKSFSMHNCYRKKLFFYFLFFNLNCSKTYPKKHKRRFRDLKNMQLTSSSRTQWPSRRARSSGPSLQANCPTVWFSTGRSAPNKSEMSCILEHINLMNGLHDQSRYKNARITRIWWQIFMCNEINTSKRCGYSVTISFTENKWITACRCNTSFVQQVPTILDTA